MLLNKSSNLVSVQEILMSCDCIVHERFKDGYQHLVKRGSAKNRSRHSLVGVIFSLLLI